MLAQAAIANLARRSNSRVYDHESCQLQDTRLRYNVGGREPTGGQNSRARPVDNTAFSAASCNEFIPVA